MSSTQSQVSDLFAEFNDADRIGVIRELIDQNRELASLPRSQFFYFLFADIPCLKLLRDMMKNDRQEKFVEIANFTKSYDLAGNLLGTKRQVPHDRKSSAARMATKRDNDKCLLTKREQPTLESAPIIPNTIHGQIPHDMTWSFLRVFWGDKVDEWRRQLGLDRNNSTINIEKVHNLMTLETQTRDYWDRALIAFRPISENPEKTRIDIQFHWIAINQDTLPKRTADVPLDGLPFPDMSQRFCNERATGRNIWQQEDDTIIRSGHIFIVTTDDPVRKPLPSFELLELQWHLTRIAVMQGAGED
ncbi:hypothetical protein N7456_001712 [Penicillium angulare]|uniref:HNH nuclease domain-containing protein n=1 Tax=Penicillium angulare TaxID=116970 RepID=A0A9W9G782_9EURO|nr:hypothetical protein N7456_001712 [Penicillium angulare]